MNKVAFKGRKFLQALAAAFLAGALLLTGCGGGASSQSAEEARKQNNEIVIGIPQDLDDTLDPHYTTLAGTREVMFNVFEGLVKPDSQGNLIPAVAADVQISDDGLVYTFPLRENVKFHNGETVTAEDVIWSIRRNIEDENGTNLIPALQNIQSLDSEGSTVVITLADPNPEFLSYLTLAVLPADYADQATQPVGTGPYKFVSRAAQDNVVLERFEDYWGEGGHVDKVTYKIIGKADGLVQGLQSGALDLVSHMTTTQTSQLDESQFHIEEGTMNLVQALYLNNAEKPFDDVRVRQALCYAIDRQEILDLAFDGYGYPVGSSMFPAFGKYFDESLTDYYTYDPDEAKRLLAEAGYKDGFDMTITVPSNYQPHMDTASAIADQLSRVGIHAELITMEMNQWIEDVNQNRKFQSTVIGFDAKTLTGSAMLSRWVSDSPKNVINYNNSEYDELFAKASSTYDDAEQTQIYRQMERNLTENAANVYIQDLADLVVMRNGLTGLQFYPLYVLDVSTLQWEK